MRLFFTGLETCLSDINVFPIPPKKSFSGALGKHSVEKAHTLPPTRPLKLWAPDLRLWHLTAALDPEPQRAVFSSSFWTSYLLNKTHLMCLPPSTCDRRPGNLSVI